MFSNIILYLFMEYYQLSHDCQGDTEKYLTQENPYHLRHTCITRDVVEGNTSVSDWSGLYGKILYD